MENSVLGVWIAHGEGRFTFRNNNVLQKLKENHCLAIKYTDDHGNPTECYPLNPNGSTGIIWLNISFKLCNMENIRQDSDSYCELYNICN